MTRGGDASMARGDADVTSTTTDPAVSRHWDTVYTTRRTDEVSWYQSRPDESLRMIADASLAADAPLVDVGAGASTLVDELTRRGHTAVTVLDIAPHALAVSRERLGEAARGVEWVAADVLAWRPARLFALWHDRAVFHFLTEPGQRRAYVETLRACVRPSGTVILATFALDGPQRCSGLPTRRYDADMLAGELGAEFALRDTTRDEHMTPARVVQAFVYARFVRTARALGGA